MYGQREGGGGAASKIQYIKDVCKIQHRYSQDTGNGITHLA